MAQRFAEAARAHRGDPRAFGGALLTIEAIFGADLPRDPRFVGPTLDALAGLFADGAAKTLERLPPRFAKEAS